MDTTANSSSPSVRLRLRLGALMLVALLPLLAWVVLAAEATRHATLDWLEAELGDAAAIAAAQEGRALSQAAGLLRAMEDVARMDAQGCAALRPFLAGGPATGLAMHGADGRVLCGDVGGAGHVRDALARAALTKDGLVLDATPGGLVLARAVPGGAGVLALLLPPAHLPPLALPLRREAAGRMLVDVDDGVVLIGDWQGAAAGGQGGTVGAPRLLAALRGFGGGTVTGRDGGGPPRLVGHAPVPVPESVSARLAMVIALDQAPLLAEAAARRAEQWVASGALALIGLLGAWLLAQAALVRPVRALLERMGGQGQARTLAALRPAGEWLRQHADMAAAVEAAGEMFLRLDPALRVSYASPATRAVLGYARGEVLDASLTSEPGWEGCVAQLDALRRGADRVAPVRLQARRRDDAMVWLEVRAQALADGGFLLACRDVTAEQGLREQLAAAQGALAAVPMTDARTGLANRARFGDAIEDELRRARRSQEPVSLVLLRLEDWPATAARLGEAGVEAALGRLARVLGGMLRRPGDLAARLEEDLFALLLPTTDRIGAQRMAERLREAVAAEWAELPGAAPTAAIGAGCLIPQAGEDDRAALLELTEEAMAEARPIAALSVG